MTPAVFHILLSLLDGPRHGYAIMREVDLRSEGEVQLPPGTLYRSLQKMVEGGLIESDAASDVAAHDTRRRAYNLTRRGKDAAQQEARRLERLVSMARSKQLLSRSGSR